MVKQAEAAVELDERLSEAQAQVEALQGAAADAEARGATALAELTEVSVARDSVRGELAQTRAELEEARSQLRAAATRYRDARLVSRPEVPQELVPASDSFDEIDAGFEAALRVVSEVREKMREERQQVRVPAGSPPRRAQDLSGRSATEKIRLGIEERDRR
jgi:chromosome segregation ATPase